MFDQLVILSWCVKGTFLQGTFENESWNLYGGRGCRDVDSLKEGLLCATAKTCGWIKSLSTHEVT